MMRMMRIMMVKMMTMMRMMRMMLMRIYDDDGDDGDVELKCKSDKANSTTGPLFAEHLIFNLKRPPPTL